LIKEITDMADFISTERTEVHRLPKRAHYERDVVYGILDEGLVCHIGFVADGKPVVIPTGYARQDDALYVHGSAASRMLRTLSQGIDVCVTVTLLDGLVLARSAFHHSMNYRSVVIFGRATEVQDSTLKIAALRAFTEHVMSGRWSEIRPPSSKELQATMVLTIPLTEGSAKVRTGPPIDDETDYDMPVWAGILPCSLQVSSPVPDERLPRGILAPEYLKRYQRNRG
jgi:uncharacterized protein